MPQRSWVVLSTCFWAACSAGSTAPPHADLGEVDLAGADLLPQDLSANGASSDADLSQPGILLVEDFCTADLGMPYTRCYVTQQPIDGY
jgi:hypothetical protein